MEKRKYQIGIDLGTVNTLVYLKGHGVIFNEPSVVAFDKKSGKCIAVGQQASDMVGKEHDQIRVVKPMNGGVISDLNAITEYLLYIFKRLESTRVDFKKSTVLICSPSQVSQIERKSMILLGQKIGINDVFVEEEIKAGAIGSGIDIFAPRGSLVIDIGGGTADIGVLALGDLVVTESVRNAGNYIDSQITKYIKMKYGMDIGPKTAEQIKIQIGTVEKEIAEDKVFSFAGRNISSGLPCKMSVKTSEIRKIIIKCFEGVVVAVRKVLQQTPPELAADIFDDGIILNGGGALIPGLAEFLTEELSLKVKVSSNPLTAIVEGTKLILKNRGNYLVKPHDL